MMLTESAVGPYIIDVLIDSDTWSYLDITPLGPQETWHDMSPKRGPTRTGSRCPTLGKSLPKARRRGESLREISQRGK
jgi:hypothetical protein